MTAFRNYTNNSDIERGQANTDTSVDTVFIDYSGRKREIGKIESQKV